MDKSNKENMELRALAKQISSTFKRFDEARSGQLQEAKRLEERIFGTSDETRKNGKKLFKMVKR